MPLYEYQCQNCTQQVEVLVLGNQKPECPLCGSKKLDRHLSVVATPSTKSSAGDSPPMPQGGCGRPQCGMHGCQGLG